jgi:hypothetical protein
MTDETDEMLTIDEISADLEAGRRTAYCIAASRQAPALKLRTPGLFWLDELDEWIGNSANGKRGAGGPE